MKKAVVSFLSLLVALTLSFDSLAALDDGDGSLISVALSQIEYEEGKNGYTKYGEWYGISRGDWCDMFVSWCADQAGIPESVFPRSASCTVHMNSFAGMGRYHNSAARGGGYVPRQGDLIFFFDPVKYPKGSVLQHVGIVLCVENGRVFTVEGNTLTNRLDDPSYYEAADPLGDKSDRPNDYVAVKHYPLDAERIHGYAELNQEQADHLPDGFADLGKYEPLREVFDTLNETGIMPGTSRYTFSPRYGVTRGEFLKAVMELYGLLGWDASVEEFGDVPADSAYYEAVMTARAAGVVYGGGNNAFFPDRYISPAEARAILSRTMRYAGQEERDFVFSKGDFSYLTPYTLRADAARVLYELLCEMSVPEETDLAFTVNGRPADWRALTVSGEYYVSLDTLRQTFPKLKTAEEPAEKANNGGEEDGSGAGQLPIPMAHCDRVLLSAVSLLNGEAAADITAFTSSGVPYVNLQQAAELLGMKTRWNSGRGTVELLRKP